MIKFLFVTNSPSGGGAERATNILVKELQNQGVEVGLLTINDGQVDLVQPWRNQIFLGRRWRGGLIETLRAGISFRKAVSKVSPTVLIANCDLPEFMVAFFAPKCRIICVEHSRKPWINRKLLGRLTRMLLTLRKADWIVVSTFLKPWAVLNPNVLHLGNPIDLEALGAPLPQLSSQSINQIQKLVFVGRLTSELKRPDWAVRIAHLVDLPIVFIGPEADKQKLEPLIVNLEVKAEFRGQLNNPWVNWDSGNLLIIPSSHEADGLVALEAIGLNIPLLMSDINEFRRFGLGEHFYCLDELAFTSIIEKNKSNIGYFQPGLILRKKIQIERSPFALAKRWTVILESMTKK
jgi:glycosyltransferase involved in cell wall biosynthesis